MTTVNGNAGGVTRLLMRHGGWWRWSAAAGSVRLPAAMAALGMVYAGAQARGSYAAGAVLGATYAVVEACAAPWAARLVPRYGRRGMSASLLLAAVAALGLAGCVRTQASMLILMSLTGLIAAVPAGVPGSFRALLPKVVPGSWLPAAYAWDAALLEVQWLAAPVLVSGAVLAGGGACALAAMSLVLVVAAVQVLGLPSPARPTVQDATTAERGSIWNGAARANYFLSFAMGVGEAGVIAGLPALLPILAVRSEAAGLLAAAVSAASIVGGAGYGMVQHRLPGDADLHAGLLLAGLGALLLPVAFAAGLSTVLIPLILAGLLIAPLNGLRARLLAEALPAHRHVEGFSVQYAAMGLGASAGALLVAAMLTVGPRVATATPAATLLVLGAVACTARLCSTWPGRPRRRRLRLRRTGGRCAAVRAGTGG